MRVVDAKPQGGVKKLTFDKGDQIRFRVVSDTADEIHVHGYDLMKDVAKGGSVTFSFKGSIDGRFVVELEDHGEQIAELDVAAVRRRLALTAALGAGRRAGARRRARWPTAWSASRTCRSRAGCSRGPPPWCSSSPSSRWPCCGRARAWSARASAPC